MTGGQCSKDTGSSRQEGRSGARESSPNNSATRGGRYMLTVRGGARQSRRRRWGQELEEGGRAGVR